MTFEIRERLEINNVNNKAFPVVQKLWEYIILICMQFRNESEIIKSLSIGTDSECIKIECTMISENEKRIIVTISDENGLKNHAIYAAGTTGEIINQITLFSSKLLSGQHLMLEGCYLPGPGIDDKIGTVFWKDFLTDDSEELLKYVSYQSRESFNSDINNTYKFGVPAGHLMSA